MLYFLEPNKPSKNIAEVSISLDNDLKDGPHQYRNLDEIEIRKKSKKIKDQSFILIIEVRAKDAQMFFADLSTDAHHHLLLVKEELVH